MSADEMKDKTKAIAHQVMQKIAMYGFYALLVFGVGFYFGQRHVNSQNNGNVATAIQLGGFVFKGDAYDISKRAVAPAPVGTPVTPARK